MELRDTFQHLAEHFLGHSMGYHSINSGSPFSHDFYTFYS